MNLGNLDFYYYVAIGGGVLLLLSVVAYFLPVGKIKIPALVTTGFGAGAIGLMLGMVLMTAFGYQTEREEKQENPDQQANALAATKNMEGMMKGMKGGGGGMPKAGGGGLPKGGAPKGGAGKGNFGPNSKQQLTFLVTALDNVAEKPIHVKLTDEQRNAIIEQLKGLDSADEVSDEDAKAKLDAILKLLEPQKETLETVGYRWPGAGFGGGGFGKNDAPNPFKEGAPSNRLKSLMERLAAKKM